MEKNGCNAIHTNFKENICRNETDGKAAYTTYSWLRNSGGSCLHPCKYLTPLIIKQSEKNVAKDHQLELGLEFENTIKKVTSYYDYTELSFIAEVGGYIGLFLGFSLYHITDAIKYVLSKILKCIN